ncbi:hypothetical protein BDW75DRAFT_82762 [Aspergillus navahoensis]
MFSIFSLINVVFGWSKYGAAILKILALFLFIIVGLALVFGADPNGTGHHGENWQDGKAFLNGFKEFGNSVLLAILAISDNNFTGFPGASPNPLATSCSHHLFFIPTRVSVLYLVSAGLDWHLDIPFQRNPTR